MPTLTFTSSGTWQAAAAQVDCQCTGEGGTAGQAENTVHVKHGGGGGGSGAYAEETALALTINSNYSYTIGTGGTRTNTSFPGNSVTVTAAFGINGNGSALGAGGAAGSNAIAYAGGSGSNGQSGGLVNGAGGGAAGTTGPGGNASGTTGGTGTGGGGNGGNAGPAGSSGPPGSAPGGGGGGSLGAGAPGQIVIIYTASQSGTATLTGTGTLTAAGLVLSPYRAQPLNPGPTWMKHFKPFRRPFPPLPYAPPITVQGTAALTGTGTLAALGGLPTPAVVNIWQNGYGQGTTFTSVTSALQSCVVPLTPAYSAGAGSGTATEGNWLFTVATWTQDPQVINVHTGVSDDIHSWWRQFPAAGSAGYSRTSISYTPNIARTAGNIYVAPDMEIAAINVTVIEVQGLGPWDTVTGTDISYAAGATSLSLSLPAPAAQSFFIGATGGDNAGSGQAFLPSGWTAIPAQSQTNGVNTLADNIQTMAYLPSGSSSISVSGSAAVAENLSGFLLGVQVTGANPVPAGHNPNWPYVVFEAAFGGGFNTPDSELTWTDLSSRLWNFSETTGIQYQLGQIQATELELQLWNNDRALSPSNTSSPYYPDVIPGTPVRLRAALGTMGGNVINRWYVIQRNASEWGEEITDAFLQYSPVRGADLWAALSSVPPSFYRAEVYEDSPYAWWPMDDQPGNSNVLPVVLLNAALGNTNVMNIQLSPFGGIAQSYYTKNGTSTADQTSGGFPPGMASYTVGASEGWMFGDPQGTAPTLDTGNPVTSLPGSASWTTTGQAGATGSYGWFLSCNDAGFPPLSGGITVEIWFNYGFYAGPKGIIATAAGPVLQQPYNTPFTILELATSTAPVCLLQLDTSGHLNFIAGGTSHSIYTGSDLRSNSWHMVTVTMTTSAWTVWLDGGANAQVSGSASMTSAWTWLIVNGDMGSGGGGSSGGLVHGANGSFAHLAVYPYILPYYRVLDHYWAAVSAFGQLPAPTGTQVQWVVDENDPGTYTPDGSLGSQAGYPYSSSGLGNSAAAQVVATVPGGITSGPSAWATGTDQPPGSRTESLWVGWTGLAPLFNLYTSQSVGAETESSIVNGSGDAFSGGYGTSANGAGVCHVSGGDGSAPPTGPSAVGDTVGQRIERLLRGGRWTSPQRSIDPAPLLVQAPGNQSTGIQVGPSLQEIAQSDNGLLFIDNTGNLVYWQRPHLASQYGSPVWQIGPTAGKIPYYKEIRWVVDPQRIWNAITIAPFSPTGAQLPLIVPQDATAVLASQLQYGAQPLQVISWLQDQAQMQAQANWLFSTFGQGVRRAERVRIEASSHPAAWQLVLGVNVGDIVQLEDWQIGGGGSAGTYRVSQIRRHISFGSHDSEVTASVDLTLDYEPTGYWGVSGYLDGYADVYS